MSVAHEAARGVVWTTAMALASRAVGLVGTLVLTRFVAPDVMGEVVAATAVAYTVNFCTQIGASQYVVLRGDQEREALFHVTVLNLAILALPLLLAVLMAPEIAPLLSAPKLAEYLPGTALFVLISRISSVPDKLLLRRMQFRTVALANALGQIVQTAVAVSLVAATSLGGMAIVIAQISQALVVAVIEIYACGTESWLTPTRLRIERFKEILRFGLPLGFVSFFYEAARFGDKLIYTRLFGAAKTGEYNLAYSLADLPAIYVGEQVAGVLIPTLLRVEESRREQVLIRAIGLLSLATFPMAVGLGLIAPTLIDVLLPDHWHGVAPFLTVLAALSVFRPINGLLSQYLISLERNRILLLTEVLRATVLFGGLFVLGLIGPVAAAFAVGCASFAQTCVLVRAVRPEDDFVKKMIYAVRAPVLACGAMALAILSLRGLIMEFDGLRQFEALHELTLLVVEIAGGAGTFVSAMFLMARSDALEALELARRVVRSRAAA